MWLDISITCLFSNWMRITLRIFLLVKIIIITNAKSLLHWIFLPINWYAGIFVESKHKKDVNSKLQLIHLNNYLQKMLGNILPNVICYSYCYRLPSLVSEPPHWLKDWWWEAVDLSGLIKTTHSLWNLR